MLFQLHKSFGLTVLALSIVRLGWRLINPIPPLPRGLNPLLRLGAHASHFLLYFLIIAIPLAGWADGFVVVARPADAVFRPVLVAQHSRFWRTSRAATKAANLDLFKHTHSLLAFGAIGLVSLHVLAALYHQFIRRDDVLQAHGAGHRCERSRMIRLLAIIAALLCAMLTHRHRPRSGMSITPRAGSASPCLWSGQPFDATFKSWKADINFDPADLAHAKAIVTIDLGSEASAAPDNDDGLKGAEGFAVSQFPAARFDTTGFSQRRRITMSRLAGSPCMA